MITLKNGRIQFPIQKGVDSSIILSKPTGWAQYEVMMEVKTDQQINRPALITLKDGEGLTISDTLLTVNITNEQSKLWEGNKLFADIKLRDGETVLPAIPIDIILINTVTDI